MEFEKGTDSREAKTDTILDPEYESSILRSKSSLRLKYEAERSILKAQLGGLEEIRKRLGLTQRKMTQLLLVDPSAWTRWIKDESKVPPHIYRSLQWYLNLIDKKPEWSPQNSFQPYIQMHQPRLEKQWDEIQITVEKNLQKIKARNHDFESKMESKQLEWEKEKQLLEEKIEKKDMSLTVWKLIVLLHTCALLFGVIWVFF